MWLERILGWVLDGMAVVRRPRGLARMRLRRFGILASAWMPRRYILDFEDFGSLDVGARLEGLRYSVTSFTVNFFRGSVRGLFLCGEKDRI